MTVELLTANHVPAGTWLYELTEQDFAKPWHPKESRIEQLRGNTRCTGYRSHENIGDYPIIDFKWACARARGPYRGRFPGGFMERLETMLYVFNLVPDFNPNRTMMLFVFGGSVVKKDNLHTIDIRQETNPTFCGDATRLEFMDTIPDEFYDLIIIDPPYNVPGGRNYAEELYGTKPFRPYDFAGNKGHPNIATKVKKKGVVFILHQMVYKKIPLCERIGVGAISTGPGMRMRALNMFIKVG